MSVIELSTSFGIKQVKRFINVKDQIRAPQYWGGPESYAYLSPLISSGCGGNDRSFCTFINIMQGVVPTDFTNLGMTITTTSSSGIKRPSDFLVSIPCSSPGIGDISGFDLLNTDITKNPCVINTLFKPAIKTGLATWFYVVTIGGPTNMNTVSNVTEFVSEAIPDYAGKPYVTHQAFGTVGVTNSGADLEIPDVNIVEGQPYRIANLRLKLPTSWVV